MSLTLRKIKVFSIVGKKITKNKTYKRQLMKNPKKEKFISMKKINKNII